MNYYIKNEKGTITNTLSFLFSLFALLISIGTFLLLYDNGRLVKNVRRAKRDISSIISAKQAKGFNFNSREEENAIKEEPKKGINIAVLNEIRDKIEEAKQYFQKSPNSLLVKSKLNEAQEIIKKYKKELNSNFIDVVSEKIDIIVRNINEKSKYIIENFDDLINYLKVVRIDDSELSDSKGETSTPDADASGN